MTDPTVIHETELCTIVHGSSLAHLPTLPKESFDLVIADPPYGQEWRSNSRAVRFDMLDGDGADQASRDDVREMLREAVRLTAQSRHLYVFGPTDVLDGLKVSAPAELVWDKATLGSGDVTAPWGPAHEPINFVVGLYRHAGKAGKDNIPVRLRKGSVLRFPRPTGRKVRHPSEKPVPLLRELIESSSRQGDIVLDPFGGSGSTAVAAILSGRRAYIVESDRRWADLAVERAKAAETHYIAGRWL